jgi:hypothetical protein
VRDKEREIEGESRERERKRESFIKNDEKILIPRFLQFRATKKFESQNLLDFLLIVNFLSIIPRN